MHQRIAFWEPKFLVVIIIGSVFQQQLSSQSHYLYLISLAVFKAIINPLVFLIAVCFAHRWVNIDGTFDDTSTTGTIVYINFTDVNMLAVNPQIQVLTPSEIGLEDLWYNSSIENQHFVMCERPEGRIPRVTCLLESVIPTLWNLQSRYFRKRLAIVVEGTFNLFIW